MASFKFFGRNFTHIEEATEAAQSQIDSPKAVEQLAEFVRDAYPHVTLPNRNRVHLVVRNTLDRHPQALPVLQSLGAHFPIMDEHARQDFVYLLQEQALEVPHHRPWIISMVQKAIQIPLTPKIRSGLETALGNMKVGKFSQEARLALDGLPRFGGPSSKKRKPPRN